MLCSFETGLLSDLRVWNGLKKCWRRAPFRGGRETEPVWGSSAKDVGQELTGLLLPHG